MSRKLPETQSEMLTVVGVTRANFEKYGKPLLKITQQYAEEKSKVSGKYETIYVVLIFNRF